MIVRCPTAARKHGPWHTPVIGRGCNGVTCANSTRVLRIRRTWVDSGPVGRCVALASGMRQGPIAAAPESLEKRSPSEGHSLTPHAGLKGIWMGYTATAASFEEGSARDSTTRCLIRHNRPMLELEHVYKSFEAGPYCPM